MQRSARWTVPRCRSSTLFAVSAASIAALHASIAWADPQKDVSNPEASTEKDGKGKELYAVGRAAYESGDYETAAAAFRESYELTQAPRLLFNIAQALRLAGRCNEAVDYYRRYRKDGTDLPNDLGELEQEAERCARDEAEAVKPSRAQASADTPAAPTPAPISPKSLDPSEGSGSSVPAPGVRAPKREVSKDDATNRGWPWTRWAGLSSLAVAAGSGVAATIFTVQAANASDRTEDLSRNGGTWDLSARENEAAGKTAERWAIGLFAATAVTSGLGVWLLVQPVESSRVSVSGGPDRVLVSFRRSFR